MAIIGLELNDSGILAAGGSPSGLLNLDGEIQESPGFALPQKKRLLVGKAAEHQAHLFPRQILHHFWDQLTTAPLEQTGRHLPRNHAEIVYHHLSLMWQQLQPHGDEIVMLVPSFYQREQLGLILGIAQELGMPIKGFVPLSLAASSLVSPEKMLLHLDIFLHRIEVIYLEQGEDLVFADSATTAEKGLLHLYRKLLDMIAREFVRHTRFDPLHQAASEQELYNRLPAILSHLQHDSSMILEIAGSTSPYSIMLERDSIVLQAEAVYSEIIKLIKRMQKRRGKGRPSLALQLSHRLSRLPGCRQALSAIKDAQIIELDRGAAARGVLQIWDQLAAQSSHEATSYFTRRPWQRQQQTAVPWSTIDEAAQPVPTHLLYRNIAYPITEKPLTIGCASDREQSDVTITGETTGVSPKHFTIERRGSDIVLDDMSEHGTFVNEKRVNGKVILKLGQKIRVGTPGEQLQLIVCMTTPS